MIRKAIAGIGRRARRAGISMPSDPAARPHPGGEATPGAASKVDAARSARLAVQQPRRSILLSSVFGFDMTRVLDDPVIRTAALMYIFHRTEELLTGDPVMIFLDEGWRLLDDDVFAFFIRDKLKTIRKQNGIVGFGTQSAADIVRSKASQHANRADRTNIFFPNPKADRRKL